MIDSVEATGRTEAPDPVARDDAATVAFRGPGRAGPAPTPASADGHPGPGGGIDLAEDGEAALVSLWGDVDASLRDQASSVMADVALRPGPVVVDASRVTFLDSTGLAFVLQLVRVGEEEHRSVVLQNPPEHVMDLVDLVGMRERLPVRRTGTGHEQVAAEG